MKIDLLSDIFIARHSQQVEAVASYYFMHVVAARIPLIALQISCIKCKNLLSFEQDSTEKKEDNSFKLHFKVGKGLKIFQPSKY